jgi:hypothetical protein
LAFTTAILLGMVDKLKANGADGVVMFNRFYEPDINLETLEMAASSKVFSSPADIRRYTCVGLEWFRRLCQKLKLQHQQAFTMAMQ